MGHLRKFKFQIASDNSSDAEEKNVASFIILKNDLTKNCYPFILLNFISKFFEIEDLLIKLTYSEIW